MNELQRPVRMGRIDYTNVWPLFFRFPLASFEGELEVVQQLPTQLNQAMAGGTVDVGPISSFAYAEHPEDYLLFPDMSVSSHGAVHSILLFHKQPLPQLDGKRIALTTSSATSVHLLKIILDKFYKVAPQYVPMEPDLTQMMQNADAALLIGDHAIKASWRKTGYLVTDLGEEWEKWTGHWMSFAVCTIRKSLAESQPALVSRLYEAFLQSKKQSLADLTAMVQEAQQKIGGTASYWHHYFSNLCYEFGDKQQAGLKQYYDYAAELGFLDASAPLHMWFDKKTAQVTE